MRPWPDSIAGRIVGLLFAGLLLTVFASTSIYMLDIFHGKGWDDTFRNLQRISIIATIMDRASPEARFAWLPVLSEPGLSVVWEPHQAPPTLRQDGMTRHLARDVRVLSESHGLNRVEAGYPAGGRSEGGWMMPQPGPAQVWIELLDKTWLRFVVASEQIGGLWTLRLVLAVGLLVTGIMALGVWASRKLTAPLAQFAEAALRLGANVHAEPMCENGPAEIRQATVAFNEMQNRIRRLIEDRTLMLAAISHDLRTVLTRLRFRTEFIRDPRQRHKANADMDEMQAMLASALSLARNETISEPVIILDLAMLLQSLCDDLSDAGRPVSYEGPLHLNYEGRPLLLRRAFANLIDNALAYGGQASVALAEMSDSVEITVGDRGPGIPETMREKVFSPFFRLEASRNRETGGTGLGLTVARAVARRHGGDITLSDREGGGLLAKIILPRRD